MYTPITLVLQTISQIIDPDGRDSLIIHRSEPLKQYSDENAAVYELTFSLVVNGESTPLEGTMYMLANAKSDKEGDNGLKDKSAYTLEFKEMTSHDGDKGFENTIHIKEAGGGNVYIHPGNTPWDFGGCKGVSGQKPLRNHTNTYGTTIISNTRGGLKQIRDMYDKVKDELTGEKFLIMPSN